MLDLLAADENLAFGIALALMYFLALLEGVGIFLGAGLSGLVDALLPDSLASGLDIDAPDTGSMGGVSSLLG